MRSNRAMGISSALIRAEFGNRGHACLLSGLYRFRNFIDRPVVLTVTVATEVLPASSFEVDGGRVKENQPRFAEEIAPLAAWVRFAVGSSDLPLAYCSAVAECAVVARSECNRLLPVDLQL